MVMGKGDGPECDVCRAENINTAKRCGKKGSVKTAKLYHAYVGRVVTIRLCHLHDIELFLKGEMRFLQNHLNFSASLAKRGKEED